MKKDFLDKLILSEGCHCLLAQLCLTLCDYINCIVRQAPLSKGFSRQEYWSGLSFPSPGGSSWHRDQTWLSVSSALQVDSLPLSHLGSLKLVLTNSRLEVEKAYTNNTTFHQTRSVNIWLHHYHLHLTTLIGPCHSFVQQIFIKQFTLYPLQFKVIMSIFSSMIAAFVNNHSGGFCDSILYLLWHSS